MIECKNVGKVYRRGVVAIRDMSFTIEEGEFVYLLGASGSGKSTLLKTLYRDEAISSGTVMIDERDISKIKVRDLHKLRRDIGIIFQEYHLLPKKTVYENVRFALEILAFPEEEMDARIRQTLTLVELADKADCYPEELSGGQQQRVAIARALINEPRILLADEPTGNLDPRASMEIFRLLMRINRRGTTVLLATHDQHIFQRFHFRSLTMSGDSWLLMNQKKQLVLYSTIIRKKIFILCRKDEHA
ncbi:ATP-binding cassette domain-containing protein [Jeotgalibaca porci]|uniref:ATP-binding cassette domain-containing protein n=1 Tax=Jeotgalibaca porci TaxID=1868793 RepID=A0A6G7WKH6_9LACT|nr:ATP-binding cassette domain-containing protein [Jeotgalibaca porci]